MSHYKKSLINYVSLFYGYLQIVPVYGGRWDDFETTTTPIPLPFFADKTNLLMYIILPAFIIIVGGSVLLYVVHKLRRAYGKRKEQHKRETQVAPAPNYEKPPATVLMTVVVDGKKTLRAVPW